MTIQSKPTIAFLLLALMLATTPAGALELTQNRPPIQELMTVRKTQDTNASKSHVRVLSDHPGSATALTARQKFEIEQIVAKSKGNQSFICTGASLSGQRESMYRVVLLRAQLVCDYAKSLNPGIKTTVQEKTTAARQFNGRVVVVSK